MKKTLLLSVFFFALSGTTYVYSFSEKVNLDCNLRAPLGFFAVCFAIAGTAATDAYLDERNHVAVRKQRK